MFEPEMGSRWHERWVSVGWRVAKARPVRVALALEGTPIHFSTLKILKAGSLGLLEMLSGLIIVLFIGVLVVGWQVRTAAVQNPTDLLRDE